MQQIGKNDNVSFICKELAILCIKLLFLGLGETSNLLISDGNKFYNIVHRLK